MLLSGTALRAVGGVREAARARVRCALAKFTDTSWYNYFNYLDQKFDCNILT